MKETLRRLVREERGITGLETAIILIAFVVVASVFSYVVLSAGFLAADQAKGTILEGLDKTEGTLEVRGSIIGRDVGVDGDIDTVEFVIAPAINGQSVRINSSTTTITYWDSNQKKHLAFTVGAYDPTLAVPTYPDAGTWGSKLLIDGGAVGVLDGQDQMAIAIDLTTLTTLLTGNTSFVIEVKPPVGGVLVIERRTPAAVYAVTDMH